MTYQKLILGISKTTEQTIFEKINPMKKTLALLSFCVLLLAGCSKQKQLTRRLDGKWNITKVTYTATPSGIPTQITGTGQNTSGYLNFVRKDMTADYNVTFNTEPASIFGQTIPSIPVSIVGNGTFTNTETDFTITQNDSAKTKMDFVILKNEKTAQTWKTTTTTNINMGGQALPVSVTLTIDVTKE